MLILAVLALGFILPIVLVKVYDGNDDWYLIAAVFGAFLFIAAISVPLNRMGVHDTLTQVEAIRATKPLSDVQDAAWRMKAADANAEIASLKYWNRTAFDIWIPDDVDAVEPLQ